MCNEQDCELRPTAAAALQAAMELESIGQVFYEVVATGSGRGNRAVGDFFLRLAREEEEHWKIFGHMLGELAEQGGAAIEPLTDSELEYFRGVVNERLIPDVASCRQRASQCSVAEAISLGLKMERDSIAFYREVLLPHAGGRDAQVIQRIIEEERKHERDLVDSLKLA